MKINIAKEELKRLIKEKTDLRVVVKDLDVDAKNCIFPLQKNGVPEKHYNYIAQKKKLILHLG